MTNKEIDSVTGVETTGHVWDGDLRELNKPLPRWWLYTFYACIVWAIGYWIVYPAWPTLNGYTKGYLGYSQRGAVDQQVADAKAAQGKYLAQIAAMPLEDIEKNQELMPFVIAGGAAVFGDNCSPCHGKGAQGGVGYPNLNDDDWLWGGTPGRRSSARSHTASAPAIRRRTIRPCRASASTASLKPAEIEDVAQHVLSFSGKATDAAAAERGTKIFADNCAVCHGEAGKGNPELGAPNLTDGIWLYGGKLADIEKTVETGRGGVMPYWNGRLDPVTIKMLAAYVHSLGGGK